MLAASQGPEDTIGHTDIGMMLSRAVAWHVNPAAAKKAHAATSHAPAAERRSLQNLIQLKQASTQLLRELVDLESGGKLKRMVSTFALLDIDIWQSQFC